MTKVKLDFKLSADVSLESAGALLVAPGRALMNAVATSVQQATIATSSQTGSIASKRNRDSSSDNRTASSSTPMAFNTMDIKSAVFDLVTQALLQVKMSSGGGGEATAQSSAASATTAMLAAMFRAATPQMIIQLTQAIVMAAIPAVSSLMQVAHFPGPQRPTTAATMWNRVTTPFRSRKRPAALKAPRNDTTTTPIQATAKIKCKGKLKLRSSEPKMSPLWFRKGACDGKADAKSSSLVTATRTSGLPSTLINVKKLDVLWDLLFDSSSRGRTR